MQKTLADIPVGKEISSTPPREHWSPLTTNNFAQMTGRSSKGWKGYDYSHILKPELREKGYTLSIHHDNPHENVGDKRFYKKALVATVKHKGKKIGNTVGYLHDNGNLELATEFASHISPLHRGKGLGVSMYEGVMSHAKNALNGNQVVGGVHSTMASKVHGALAKKHGLEYNPTAQVNDKPTGEYDDKFGAYNYALKSEELNKALADIPVGKKISDKENNYDHVLSPEHRKEGYSLNVLNDNGKLFSVLKHNGKAIGNVYGSHHGSNTLDLSSGFASHIAPEHQNKGLGKAIYEALLSHAHNGMGIDKVVGGKHSTSASKVHSALAAKHGLGYIPESNSEATMSDTEYNQKVPKSLSSFTSNVKYGPYSYMLKSEQSRVLSQIRNITSLLKTLQTVQPDHTIPSEPGYSYHITNADNLHSIADSGLGTFKPWHGSEQNSWPDGATEKRNYFHSNIQGTLPFGSGTKNAILRVNQNAHPVKKERGTGDLYSRKTVHPDNIELLTEHGWHPITKWSQDKIKPQIQLNFPFAKSLSKSSVEDTMHEFKEGTLHSGSKSGPKVTDKDQAVAIALNQNKKSEHMWRTRPILKSKDADGLDQSAAAYAIKLGDIKRAEDTAYNEYERNHRLDAAAHHYKALGTALAKGHHKAADHHRLAYQGHCQALGINGLESAPRMIMERVRQLTDNEPDRFKSHPADIF